MANPYCLSDSVTVSGTDYAIRSDFRTVLDILVMLSDPDLNNADKTEALLRMFYVQRPPETAAAVEAAVRFINPRQNAPNRPNLVDWEQDFPLMAAPINRILGFDCRGSTELHWYSFLSAFLEIGSETLYGRVLRVREKLKTGKKLEKYEREFLRRNRDLVLLPSRCSTAEQEILKDWTERKNL